MKRNDREGRDQEELGREEIAGHESHARESPHVTENDEDGEIQANAESSSDVAALPANASGTDRVSVAEQDEPIDPGSMYDGRPERDKDQPPSKRVTE